LFARIVRTMWRGGAGKDDLVQAITTSRAGLAEDFR
jgi:hypothetical protein